MESNLSKKALIAGIKVSCWTGQITDKQVSREVETAKNAEKGSGKYAKLLLDKKALSPLSSRAMYIRSEHRRMTLPWNDGNDRLLPISMHVKYKTRMDELSEDFMAERVKFLDNYVAYKTEAKTRLGDLYNEGDYPDVDEIGERIAIHSGFTTVPDAEHFMADMANDEQERLRKEVGQEIEGRMRAANSDLYARLQEGIEGICERMIPGEDGKPVAIRETALTNLQALLETVEELNLMDSSLIKTAVSEIHKTIDGVSANELREKSKSFSPERYNEVRTGMEKLQEQFSGFFGQPVEN